MLGDYEAFNDREEEFAQRVMLRHGIPDEMVDGLRAVLPAFRRWGQAVQITRPLREGDTLEFANRRLEVLHRPGHSPSDTVLYDRERGILIAADHLLAHISSNPVIALRAARARRRRTAPLAGAVPRLARAHPRARPRHRAHRARRSARRAPRADRPASAPA